jgi:hypothetical protein
LFPSLINSFRNKTKVGAITALSSAGSFGTRSALPVFNESYNEVAKLYLVALTKAAPEIEEEHIHRAFQFLLATMYCAGADNRRIDNLSSGKFSSQDFDRIYESIIPFVTGGFKALAKASIVSHVRGDAS